MRPKLAGSPERIPLTSEPEAPVLLSREIQNHRLEFLSAIRVLPAVHERFMELQTKTELTLAEMYSRRRRPITPATALYQRIQQWADSCNLGRPPIDKCWIYEVAIDWLRRIVEGPPSVYHLPECPTSDDDEKECECPVVDSADWNNYCSIAAGRTEPWKQIFTHAAFNPVLADVGTYRKQLLKSVTKHICEQKALYRRLRLHGSTRTYSQKHYSWLVKNQILGMSFEQIELEDEIRPPDARKSGADSVRVDISDLRLLIVLPPLRKSGRPRKL